MKGLLNLVVPQDPIKRSTWQFHRMLEVFLALQVWFVVYLDLWCGYITTRLPYCLFFLVLHPMLSFIFSTKGALSFEKRKSQYTILEKLAIDLKEIGTRAAPFLLRFIGFFLLSKLYLLGLDFVLEFMGLAQAIVFVFSLYYSFGVNLFVIIFIISEKLTSSVSMSTAVPYKKRFLNLYLLKKLKLFERKNIHKHKTPFVYLLGSLSFVSVFRIFPYALAGISFFFDFGRSLCCYHFLLGFVTYMLTFESVSSPIKNLYGKDGLRLLGWNMLKFALSANSRTVAKVAIYVSTAAGGDRIVGSQLDKIAVKAALEFDLESNKAILILRQQYIDTHQSATFQSIEEKYPLSKTSLDVKPLHYGSRHIYESIKNVNKGVQEGADTIDRIKEIKALKSGKKGRSSQSYDSDSDTD